MTVSVLGYRSTFPTRNGRPPRGHFQQHARHTDPRYEIMSFIEWYTHRRRHTSLDNISPVRYEENHQNSAHAA